MQPNPAAVEFLLRWFHFIFGILWIGHLYFFNFVNGNFQAALDATTKQKVVPELMPRALWFFRWGAMLTLLTGLGIIAWKHFLAGPEGFAILMQSSWGKWIGLGAVLGIIMWFNVWFIIWPAQKKIIAAVKAGEKPDAAVAERARKASKLNTFLSVPMLFGMGAASHFPFFNPVLVIGALIIGFLIAHLLYKIAPKVGKSL